MTERKKERKNNILNEIEKNRNHSWIRELIRNNKLADDIFAKLEKTIDYKSFATAFPELSVIVFKYFVDSDICKSEFVWNSFQWARLLRYIGIARGTEFVSFMDRTPEYTYLIGAANIAAATINLVCEKFSLDYIKDSILPNCDSRYVFIQDNKLQKLEPLVRDLENYTFVVIPVMRSAKNRTTYNKYCKKFYQTNSNEIERIENTYSNIIDIDKALCLSSEYKGKVEEPSGLYTIFTVTYSSGTTGNPKGIVHSNRHYITMARYHDSEVSGLPNMGNLSTYSNIPAYSNSYVLSALSDNLMKNGLNMLDPIDDGRYFPIGLKINHGNMNFGSCSGWNILALKYFCDPQYRNYRIEDAIFNFAVGEGFGPGEEALCNRFLRAVHAGRRIKVSPNKTISLPVGLAMMSVAGGECEVGSIFIRIHRSLLNKSLRRKKRKDPIGMSTYDFVDVKILREDGTYADPYEIGRVTVLSDCNMRYYNHDPEATAQFYIRDYKGIKRADMKDYGYVDERGFITIKDRIRESVTEQYEFRIDDAVSRDYKNIAVVKTVKNGEKQYVSHIIMQPAKKLYKEKILEAIKSRVIEECGKGFALYIKIRDPQKYFPLTKSLKVDKEALIQEGLEDAIKII